MCLIEIGRMSKIVLIRDMNGRFGNIEVADVVGKWGMNGVNEMVNTWWTHVQKGICS